MATTVFLIHGMGAHSDKWSAAVIEKLQELYERYPRLDGTPFEKRIRPITVHYDGVFKKILKDWSSGAQQIGQCDEKLKSHQIEKLVSWLKDSSNETDNFAWTHAADVFMYRGFASVRQQTKVEVANQICAALDDMDSDDQWVVLAHSLGTAVAHDALHALWSSNNPDGSPTGYGAKDNKARAVIMVANVCRALQTAPKVLSESFVRPGNANSQNCGCFRYINVRHAYDPFVFFQPFKPTAWPTANAEASGMYAHLVPDHIWQFNVHDLNHYLEHPMVHIPVLRALSYDSAITKDEAKQAAKEFKPYGPMTDAAANALRGRLERLMPAGTDDWTSWKRLWEELFGGDNIHNDGGSSDHEDGE